AVYSLAKHINKQQQYHVDRQRNLEPQSPVLRFLFPFRSIGAIIGSGGSHASKLRAKSGITRFHVFEDSIPFTQERIVEMGGSASALKAATMLMLGSTGSSLRQMQETSTLYQPVKNGLLQMIARDSGHKDGLFVTNIEGARTGSKHVHSTKRPSAESEDRSRKRSRSLLGIDDADDGHSKTKPSVSSESSKKPRRMSDNSDYTRASARSHRSRRGSESSSARSQRYDSHKTSRLHDPEPESPRHGGRRDVSGHSTEKIESKIVVSDRLVGRLIGRNGFYLISLQDRCGASITLSPRIQGMSDRIVTMAGSHEQVNKACKLVKTSLRDFEQAGH
ncbi:hypothetical protein LPJ59_005391, partial [Coemansia sp. RSA 2399]